MLLLAIIINFVVAAWFYPELFTKMDLRLVQGHDACGPMQYTFYLIGQFYQGGVQLFNRYDLMNGSFTHLSVGLYTPMNYFIALGYVLLAPFVTDPAQFFHHWYVFVYYCLGLTLRTFGIYLLVSYMTKSRFAAIFTSVWVNCFCAIAMIHMGGMCISLVYSYLPLVLFCIVYYWETRHFKALVAIVLVTYLSVYNSVYVGLGYIYQTIHLYLFDILLIWLLFRKGRRPLLSGPFEWQTTLRLLFLTFLIFLPVLFLVHNLNDFEMASSGMGGSEGRFKRFFHPIAMMQDSTRYFVSFQDYFNRAFDFNRNAWYSNASFLGVTTILLTFIGLILGKNSFKFVFITVAVMMAFLNVPSNAGKLDWTMWAHWIDTTTNPFCFLIRSFHFIVFVWYLTLAIPIGLGVQACWAIVRNNFDSIHASRINFLKGILVGIIVLCPFIPDPQIKAYALKILSLFLIFLFAFHNTKLNVIGRIMIAGMLFTGVIATEFIVLKRCLNTQSEFMNDAYWDGLKIKPRAFNYMHTSPTPMILDYQNPKILPVRFFYRTDKHVVWPLLCEFQGWFGLFYQYMPLALRLERPSHLYVPRMKVFKNIDQDDQIQEYIKRDGRVMYMADAAIAPNQKHYAKILDSGFDRRVVQVEEAHLDQVKNWQDLKLPPALPENFKQDDYLFSIAQAKINKKPEGIQYQWPLPKNFPRYLSTSLFTDDVFLWRLNVGTKQLVPAQGALVAPFTFDVNNVRDGWVTVLMPAEQPISGDKIVLHVLTSAQLVDVWRNTQDQFGFTYNAPRGGWWVMHMPWDPKWELTIDGAKTPISKINRYFLGAPLSPGRHQILLSYWPNSPLRPLIVVSVLAVLGIMFFVFRLTYRWSKEKI